MISARFAVSLYHHRILFGTEQRLISLTFCWVSAVRNDSTAEQKSVAALYNTVTHRVMQHTS